MKRALVIGGGSKNSSVILDCLCDHGFEVVNFGSTVYEKPNVVNIKIDWNSVDIEFVQRNFSRFDGHFDFVFFNHNSSSLRLDDFCVNHDNILDVWKRIKDWEKSQWLSCQFPFLILHTIRKNLNEHSKVGWMLSSCMDYNKPYSIDFPDYSAFKFFNYLAMKSFSRTNQFKTFGIFPNFKLPDSRDRLKSIIEDIINDTELTQECFRL